MIKVIKLWSKANCKFSYLKNEKRKEKKDRVFMPA